MPRPLIVAHRGGAIPWPENGPTAFRNALALGVDQVECDVHPCASGEIVVIHDDRLDRTTEAKGAVAGLPWETLRRVRLKGGAGDTLMTLDALAAMIAPTGAGLRLELKTDAAGNPYPGLARAAAAAVDSAGLRARTMVISFHAATVADALAEGGFLGAAWLADARQMEAMGAKGLIGVARAWGFAALGLDNRGLTDPLFRDLRDAGLDVAVWTVNDPDRMRHLLWLGVESLTTDDPTAALAITRESGSAP